MDELFSCRNCVHNSGQSINIGRGLGYCLKYNSILTSPSATTCKYLHRKDLPFFVVDEGVREHAAEFAMFSGIVDLHTRQSVERRNYSERFVWEHGEFDPLVHALAQYWKAKPSWVFVQTMSGGLDGRRSIAHAALVRRYMDRCGTWKSSYRLILALIKELPIEPQFTSSDLNIDAGDEEPAARADALWDVVFTRLSGVQEYGFHSGLERLMWVTDELNGGLSSLDWSALKLELKHKEAEWTNWIVEHASYERVFFPDPGEEDTPQEDDPDLL